jgi:hypothetical protein
VAEPELSDPEAVHEVRKALKRWRALMRLLARPLGEPARGNDYLRSLAIVGPQARQQYSTDNHLLAARY